MAERFSHRMQPPKAVLAAQPEGDIDSAAATRNPEAPPFQVRDRGWPACHPNGHRNRIIPVVNDRLYAQPFKKTQGAAVELRVRPGFLPPSVLAASSGEEACCSDTTSRRV